MTYPITPNPGIHKVPAKAAAQQQFLTQQQLLTWAEQIPFAMVSAIGTAILDALGLSSEAPNFQAFLTDIKNALNVIPLGNISGLLAIVGNLETFFGDLNPLSGRFDPVGALTILINLITSLATQLPQLPQLLITDLGSALGTLTSGVSGNTTNIQSVIDNIANALGISGTGNPVGTVLTALEAIPQTAVADLSGSLSGLGSDVQNTINYATGGLSNAASSIEADLAGMAAAANSVFGNASTALGLGQAHANTLAIRNNQPASHALTPTAEATFDISALTGSEITMSSTASLMGFIRCKAADNKGIVEWIGGYSGTISNFIVNIYRMNTTSGNLTLLYTSPNLTSELNTAIDWQTLTLATTANIAVSAGDVLAVEFVLQGSGSYYVDGNTVSFPPHPTALPKLLGASRNPTGNLSPSAITSANVGYSTTTPFIALGISALPVDYQPNEPDVFTTSGTYTLPSWLVAGDYIDVIAVGGGVGGTGGYDTLGGNPGSWNATTITYGTTIPTSVTTLAVTVGAGSAGGAFGSNGAPGGNSTVANGGTTLLTASGGTGTASSISGGSPGDETFNGTVYYGGAGPGSAPGSGGNGTRNAFGTPGYAAAPGAVFIVARQQ